jgi:peptidoglycan hydrolase CwlO-like protein
MPPNPQHETIEEIYKLTKDNNRMLRSMRRNAFMGGILRLVIYAAMIVIPFWFYQQYLSASVAEMQKALQQMQGTGTQAQVQLQSLQEALQKMQTYMPSLPKSQ